MSSEQSPQKMKKTSSFQTQTTTVQQVFFTDEVRASLEEDNYRQYLNNLDMLIPNHLINSHQARRQNLFVWMYAFGKVNLELKSKTIELTMVLFDYYCFLHYKKQSQNHLTEKKAKTKCKAIHILQQSQNSQLTLLVCLLSCSKYNEIYPPCLNDFSMMFNDQFERSAIINKELDILQLTQFAFNITTVSKWYEYLFQKTLPQWAYECYIRVYGYRNEVIATTIDEVQKLFQYQIEDSNTPSLKVKKVIAILTNSDKIIVQGKKKAHQTDKRLKKK